MLFFSQVILGIGIAYTILGIGVPLLNVNYDIKEIRNNLFVVGAIFVISGAIGVSLA